MAIKSVIVLIMTFLSALSLADDNVQEPVYCTLDFTISSWNSDSGTGDGVINCTDLSVMNVDINIKGSVSYGKNDVISGKGEFTGVEKGEYLYGTYYDTGESVSGRSNSDILRKGDVRLVVYGTGDDVNNKFSFDRMVLSPDINKAPI